MPMDQIALRYLLLGLRLGHHVPGFVRSYSGPTELREAVAGEPPTPAAELHDEAMQIAGLAAELPRDTASERRRSAWLTAQMQAMGALARRAGGEEIGYVDLVEELYDVELRLEPDSTFEAARRMIDAALPGRAPLRERLADHERSSRLPAGQAARAVTALTAWLRSRTRAQLWLPDVEAVEIEAAHDLSREAEGQYLGSGRSRIRVNVDRPLSLSAAAEIAAHDGYPGHHTEACVKDSTLVAAGHAELALICSFSPQALIGEGMAGLAREVVASDQEFGFELRKLATSLAVTVDVQAMLVIQRARSLLLAAMANAAVALHRDGEPIGRVREYLADIALIGDDRLDPTVSDLTDVTRRTEPFMHVEGLRLVSDWLELQGQTHGFNRLLAEQLTPMTLRSDLQSR
jgi:hypothetical protein